ncbi:MAG: NYN domain-containing protein [Oscillospiraceae bacterium]|nr:NYN domain-containing protein [Oscillospiraceae bacterium]
MKNIEELKKIAMLIDAENAQLSKLKPILDEISSHGHIIVKKAYGDWTDKALKNWKNTLNELAIQPVQQFAYTIGKNSSDMTMIIEAMDLLYSDRYDAFVLVSSDSDFTMLATRLRASEKYVFGVGEKKTPKSFINACDDFILTELLSSKALENGDLKTTVMSETPTKDIPIKTKAKTKRPYISSTFKESIASVNKIELDPSFDIKELEPLLDMAYEKYQDEDGWVNVTTAYHFIKRAKPDFDIRSYGFHKWPDLIKSLHEKYEMSKFKGSGTVNIVAFRKKES